MDKVLNPPSGDSGWATGRSTTVRSSSEGMTAAVTVCTIAVRSTVGGGTGVSVGGGTGVWVGGMGVLVGGTGVSVGGMGVSVGNGGGGGNRGIGRDGCNRRRGRWGHVLLLLQGYVAKYSLGLRYVPRYTFRVIKRPEGVATSS